ncbi:MAG: hypothetical protein FWC78_07185 [Defluviitaleaceae bacterium]|nr:hypothetical protein [Defluviitaleaceae bacterium]
MKKGLIAFLLVCVMTLSFSVSVAASEGITLELTNTTELVMTAPMDEAAEYEEIAPMTEFTRTYWRNYGGQLQWRVWSMTNGRWLTEWANA